MSLLLLILLFCLYFLPTIVAGSRDTKNFSQVLVLNLLLWRTFLFWVISLVMALSTETNKQND